jgi:tetratricopeptide (TPR) repeat protein
MNYSINRLDVFGYHVGNLLIHLAVVIFIYLFTINTLRLSGFQAPERLALIIAGIFGLHPLNSQAVSYVSQRAETLASLFYLLAMNFFIAATKYRSAIKSMLAYIGCFTAFILGYGAKPILISIPAALITYQFLFLSTPHERKAELQLKRKHDFFIKKILFPLTLAGIGIFIAMKILKTFEGSPHVGFDIRGITPIKYLLTELEVLVIYLKLILFPINLSIDYNYHLSRGFFDPETLFSLFVLTAVLFFALCLTIISMKTKKKFSEAKSPGPLAAFGIFWFFIILSPTSTIVPLKDLIFEHRVYLASWGIITSIVIGIYVLFERINITPHKKKYSVVSLIGTMILILLAVALYDRNRVWSTPVNLWSDVIDKYPKNVRGHLHLGYAYLSEGKYDEALKLFEKALSFSDFRVEKKSNILLKIGMSQFHLDQIRDAIDTLREAFQYDPVDPDILNYLSISYLELGEYGEAYYYADLAIKVKPQSGSAYNTMGEIYYKKKEYKKAVAFFKKAKSRNPDVPVRYYNIAISLEELDRIEEACGYWKEYLVLERNDALKEKVIKNIRELGCL